MLVSSKAGARERALPGCLHLYRNRRPGAVFSGCAPASARRSKGCWTGWPKRKVGMAIGTQGRPHTLGSLAVAAGLALALPMSAHAAFPGANGRLAYTVQRWRPPPPPDPLPDESTSGYKYWYDEEPVPVSARIETALPSGQRRRVLHTFPTWQPGYYGDPASNRPGRPAAGCSPLGREADLRSCATTVPACNSSRSSATAIRHPPGRPMGAGLPSRACARASTAARCTPCAWTAPGCAKSPTMRRTGRPGRSKAGSPF
jgi:hypothetical protein